MMSTLTPKDHAEAVALFRSEIVGALTRRELDRGELAQALDERSQKRFRPPGAKSTKTFSVATLVLCLQDGRARGLATGAALRSGSLPRADSGATSAPRRRPRGTPLGVRARHPADAGGRGPARPRGDLRQQRPAILSGAGAGPGFAAPGRRWTRQGAAT